jgi:hypothetical protein
MVSRWNCCTLSDWYGASLRCHSTGIANRSDRTPQAALFVGIHDGPVRSYHFLFIGDRDMTDNGSTRLVSITLGRPFAIHEDDIDIAVSVNTSDKLEVCQY